MPRRSRTPEDLYFRVVERLPRDSGCMLPPSCDIDNQNQLQKCDYHVDVYCTGSIFRHNIDLVDSIEITCTSNGKEIVQVGIRLLSPSVALQNVRAGSSGNFWNYYFEI